MSKEYFFKKDSILVSKTDLKGKITYVNSNFLKIVGLTEKELIGSPHNIVRHKDMPKIIFKYLWQYLQSGLEIHAYVKNKTSDGGFYWVLANVTPSVDTTGTVVGYHSARRVPSKEALEVIEPLYEKLVQLEKAQEMSASEAYVTKLLQEKGMQYDEFILSI